MIRVLIVDDSRTTRIILRTILETDSEIRVVGEACNGEEGCEMARKLAPDLITMDIHMPVMDGIGAVKKIMSTRPIPILIVTGAEEDGDSKISFEALQCGALDVIDKPQRAKGEKYQDLKENLIRKVKSLSKIQVSRLGSSVKLKKINLELPYRIVAIGASTGGPKVLVKILGALPADYPIGILLVQHITSNFTNGFAKWLDHETALEVKLAEPGELPCPGQVYLAPADHHMVIRQGRIALESGPARHGCIPSIDALFESVAEEYGDKAIAVLLTGMGEDGARGLKMIKDREGYTIAQEESSCVIFGMPRVAIEMGAALGVLNPKEIVKELVLAVMKD